MLAWVAVLSLVVVAAMSVGVSAGLARIANALEAMSQEYANGQEATDANDD